MKWTHEMNRAEGTLWKHIPLSKPGRKCSLLDSNQFQWSILNPKQPGLESWWISSHIGKNFRACAKATFPSLSDSPGPWRHYLDLVHSFQSQRDCCSPSVFALVWITAWTDNRNMSSKIPKLKQSCLGGVSVPTLALAREMHTYPPHLKKNQPQTIYFPCFLANLWREGSFSASISLNLGFKEDKMHILEDGGAQPPQYSSSVGPIQLFFFSSSVSFA